MHAVDRGGTILFFALFPPGSTFPFPIYELGKDGITIVHSYAGPPADMRTALDAIAAGRVDVLSADHAPAAALGDRRRVSSRRSGRRVDQGHRRAAAIGSGRLISRP